MKLLGLLYAKEDQELQKVLINFRDYNLSSFSFMYKSTVKETFKFAVRNTLQNVLKQSKPLQRHSVRHEEYICYIQTFDNSSAFFVFCDQEYPQRLSFQLTQKCIDHLKGSYHLEQQLKNVKNDDNVTVQEFSQLFKMFQDVNSVDKLTMAQNTLKETEVVLHDNIKKLLDNQKDLDQLVAQSDDLSKGAKMFYKGSKKMNKSCCQIF